MSEAKSGAEYSPGAFQEAESGTRGRPTDYTLELAAEICAQLSEGKSLRKICLAESMPDKSTVFRWLGQNTVFRDQYKLSRESGMDAMAEECLDIADDGINDYGFKEGDDEHGEGAKPVFLAEHVQRSRLRVDTRKWLMSKMAPRKYGDFQRNETDLKVSGQVIIQSAPLDEGL